MNSVPGRIRTCDPLLRRDADFSICSRTHGLFLLKLYSPRLEPPSICPLNDSVAVSIQERKWSPYSRGHFAGATT
jgi:hypothetical protein